MYPFLQLDDQTEIVHSKLLTNETGNYVKVYIEKPIDGGFYHATCYRPFNQV